MRRVPRGAQAGLAVARGEGEAARRGRGVQVVPGDAGEFVAEGGDCDYDGVRGLCKGGGEGERAAYRAASPFLRRRLG